MSLMNLLTSLNPFKKKEEVEPEIIDTVVHETKYKDLPKIDEKYNYKFSDMDKQIVVSMFAQGLTPSEVSDRARTEHNINIEPHQIGKYARAEKWQPLIRKIREVHMNNLADVSGSHKRVRLERHERVYEKAIKKGDLRNAVTATVEQRKEMEGDGNINMTLNQFNTMTDDELDHKKKLVMERIQLLNQQKEKK